jgi:Uma2 family endonuclease
MYKHPVLKYKSVEEYLAFEEQAEEKHEFYQGEIFAMAGAGFEHNQIVRNALSAIDQFLTGKACQILPSDLRVHVEAEDLFTYPDLSIVCGAPEFYANRRDTIVNPKILIEILSPSTSAHDRFGKFAFYKQIPSLQEYVMISSMEYSFEKFSRQANETWLFSNVKNPDQEIEITAIQYKAPLKVFYREVVFQNR